MCVYLGGSPRWSTTPAVTSASCWQTDQSVKQEVTASLHHTPVQPFPVCRSLRWCHQRNYFGGDMWTRLSSAAPTGRIKHSTTAQRWSVFLFSECQKTNTRTVQHCETGSVFKIQRGLESWDRRQQQDRRLTGSDLLSQYEASRMTFRSFDKQIFYKTQLSSVLLEPARFARVQLELEWCHRRLLTNEHLKRSDDLLSVQSFKISL